VLTNLVEAGYMTEGQVHAARLNPAKIIETQRANSPDWFLDWAFEQVPRVAEGRGHYVLTARTTVDLGMQQAAQDALINTLVGLTNNCLASIRQAAQRDRLVREKRLRELEAKRLPATTKCCRTCKVDKPLDEFAKHRLSKDGHRHDCKDCVANGRVKKRPPLTPEQRQADRARRDEPHRRIANEIAVAAWRNRNPQAVTARLTLAREVRSGHIMPAPTCQAAGCSSSDRLQAHHNDYRKARRVVWLCAGHHRRVHNGHRVKLKATAPARFARAEDELTGATMTTTRTTTTKPKTTKAKSAKRRSMPLKLTPAASSNAKATSTKGNRNKLCEGFIETLYDLWCEGGREALRRVMEEKPVAFMQAIGALVPKEFAVDQETAGGFAAVWRALGKASASRED
jgi:hypothetical protein